MEICTYVLLKEGLAAAWTARLCLHAKLEFCSHSLPSDYYILLILICVVVALMTIYHKQIVDWLTPFSKKVRELSWGWVIPVIILFVISFPPLFGHEIVGVLCGVVYGLWMGFGILSLGTLLGELGNFYGECRIYYVWVSR